VNAAITITAPTFTGTAFGGNQPHNNMPLLVVGTFYRKL
jgi:hypothetical protein